jgi:type VI secretion system protein ImpC
MLSAQARTPILACVSPELVGCRSLMEMPEPRDWKPDAALAAAWRMIRGMEASRYLGVVTPRFVLRLPYGNNATETESFAFEEMPTLEHESYLWGNGAVLCGLILAEKFVETGWHLSFDDGVEVHGLPVHIYREDGEARMKPCAEVLMRESALETLMEQGIMALTSLRDRDGVRLPRFQSAAQGTKQLAGRWR